MTTLTLVPASAYVPTWAPFALARLNLAEKWARVCGADVRAMWFASKPWESYAESDRALKAFDRKRSRSKAATDVHAHERAFRAAFPWWSARYRAGRADVFMCLPPTEAEFTLVLAAENARSLALIAGVDLAVLERWVMTGEVVL